eukprot:TRINITY_DN163_c0_g1_i3.p1 TRINITY_DN163_c0_g1~~TRINITY_DN163_c0_g1_i3.p1  ORF type:complete len:145 (+),score=15.32 TRINITY_DN163_c0_g1_i3:121-555(+)
MFFLLKIRRPPRSTLSSSSAASDVYKRQYQRRVRELTGATMSTSPRPYQPSAGQLVNASASQGPNSQRLPPLRRPAHARPQWRKRRASLHTRILGIHAIIKSIRKDLRHQDDETTVYKGLVMLDVAPESMSGSGSGGSASPTSH